MTSHATPGTLLCQAKAGSLSLAANGLLLATLPDGQRSLTGPIRLLTVERSDGEGAGALSPWAVLLGWARNSKQSTNCWSRPANDWLWMFRGADSSVGVAQGSVAAEWSVCFSQSATTHATAPSHWVSAGIRILTLLVQGHGQPWAHDGAIPWLVDGGRPSLFGGTARGEAGTR